MNTIPPAVLKAFNVEGKAEALEGGQGESFRVGEIVLKLAPLEAEWLAETFKDFKEAGFRIPKPISTLDGKWVSDQWCAWTFIPGQHDPRRAQEIILTAKAFHASLAELPKPNFIDQRADPWTVADRKAWGELAPECPPVLEEPIKKLFRLLKPINLPSQLIHCDLMGNVLFERGLPPGVIDFSLYWRPVHYAIAIIVVDALNWYGAHESVLQYVEDVPKLYQLLIRAQIFRVAVLGGIYQREAEMLAGLQPQLKTIEWICGTLQDRYGRIS